MRGVHLGLEDGDVRELAVAASVVEAVADDEMVRYGEADPVGPEGGFAAFGFV